MSAPAPLATEHRAPIVHPVPGRRLAAGGSPTAVAAAARWAAADPVVTAGRTGAMSLVSDRSRPLAEGEGSLPLSRCTLWTLPRD
jgi:hypothetical protein